jgi:hypothetical protein
MQNQKTNIIKPIQDQVFNTIQDIAEAKRYDFIFDKTADVVMLYASQRYDISDHVLRVIERAQKKQKMSKRQIEKLNAAEELADRIEDNPQHEERKKKLEENRLKKEKLIEERKLKREKLLEDRKKMIEDRKQLKEEQRQKALEERANRINQAKN